jgi:hypothetical protein
MHCPPRNVVFTMGLKEMVSKIIRNAFVGVWSISVAGDTKDKENERQGEEAIRRRQKRRRTIFGPLYRPQASALEGRSSKRSSQNELPGASNSNRTLFRKRTSCACLRILLAHTAERSWREWWSRFVAGSSSRYW